MSEWNQAATTNVLLSFMFEDEELAPNIGDFVGTMNKLGIRLDVGLTEAEFLSFTKNNLQLKEEKIEELCRRVKLAAFE